MLNKASLSLRGIITAVITPCTRDGELYEKGLREVVEFQVRKGIHGLFVCGTAGQGPLMGVEERKRVAQIVTEQVAGRIPVVVHVGALSTREAVELVKHAEAAGAVAVASVPPFYYRPDKKSVYKYFSAIASASHLPVFVYNNPSTTGYSLTLDQLSQLSEIPNLCGIKDAGGDLALLCKVLDTIPGFTAIIASATLVLPALAIGAVGAISSVSNVIPELMLALYEACVANRFAEARILQKQVNDLSGSLRSPMITALHEGLRLRGIDAGYTRAPLRMAEPQEIELVRKGLSKYGMLG